VPLKEKAFAFIDRTRDDTLQLWRELVNTDTGLGNKPGADAAAARLRQLLDAAGAATKIIPMERAGNMLVAEFGANRPGGVAFLGHTDTVFVPGTAAERPFEIVDGRAYGPGVLDMKGGIAVILSAVRALSAAGYARRLLKVVLVGDEAVDHSAYEASTCLAEAVRGLEAAFSCETGCPEDGIVVGRKGAATYTVEVTGVAAHAGNDPGKGRSAILEAARKIIDIEGLTDRSSGISFNVGLVRGGTAVNAVPDEARIEGEVRYRAPEQLLGIREKLEAIASRTYVDATRTTAVLTRAFPPMQTTDGVDRLFAVVAKSYAENGWGTPYRKFAAGGSDAAHSVMAGVPTVCGMGVKGGGNHSPQEFALVESLFERAKLLVACVLNLDADG